MARCIELARRAEGRTSPNPIVGAVVVDDAGNVIGEGWHQKPGEAHAEVFALDAAGDKARGATIYVSLEPCCHHGKTGPCSDRIIASGIRRVVYGLQDPNPKVGGGGIAALRAAGIQVEVSKLEKECRYLNRAWLKWITKQKMPWLIVKVAATLDGKIADREGKSKWITGEHARKFVHDVRNQVDCVMISGATAVADDPELTVRNVSNGRNPLRAVIDRRLQIDANSKLVNNEDGKTWIFSSAESIAAHGKKLDRKPVRLIETPLKEEDGGLDLTWILKYLGEQNVLSVMCESGGKLAVNMNYLTDEIYWMIAPKVMGDTDAKPAFAMDWESNIGLVVGMKTTDVIRLGDDVLIKLLM
jgi:diaminohydroxyphosphoribosylaminopyrimidine deaminase/5-amino-6-(5-phosphoribosylamino)uracil reductase